MDPEEKKSQFLSEKAKNAILAIIFLTISLLVVLAFFGKAGLLGDWFLAKMDWLLGGGKYLVPVFLVAGAFAILARSKKPLWLNLLGILLLLISSVGFLGVVFQESQGGGWLGRMLGGITIRYLDKAGAIVILAALFLISLILSFNLSIFGFLKKSKPKEEVKKEEQEERQPQLELEGKKKGFFDRFLPTEKKEETKVLRRPIFRLKKLGDLSQRSDKTEADQTIAVNEKEEGYDFPALDLLSYELDDKNSIKKSEITENTQIIQDTLENFGIPVTMGEVSVGPTVTQYTLKPARGIKLSQIVALQNDLSLALAAHPLRIEAPIPGRSWVGIEVPNKSKHIVKLRNLLEDKSYEKTKNYLTIPLGRNVSGEPIYDNLARMPHLLIAGATGTGKSVAIHNILTSFLYQNSPKTLRFIMVDPKRVELTAYNDIPHLLTPVITEAQKAINSLKWAISEMERRYELLSQIGARDLLSYNEKIKQISQKQQGQSEQRYKVLPYIVIVIDELADIMMSYGRETEAAVVRLAQMARAVGIHLILSTQRPSVEVITGLIKANITFRIAFQVASQVDSRTILDMAGAEKLLGNGDMLYQTGDSSKPKRIQGAFILEREVKKVVDFVKRQDYDEDDIEVSGVQQSEDARKSIDEFKDLSGEDDIYPEARRLVIESKKASASLLQRRLRIGYARAARLLDVLEAQGVIGPARGSKAREVLIKPEDSYD